MPSPYDLVDLADLKTWLDLVSDDDDDLLGRLITQVSRATLAFLDRANILPMRFIEVRDGRNDSEIVLRQWPVTALASLTIDGVVISAAPPLVARGPRQSGYVLEAAEAAPPGHMQRLALRGRLFNAGLQNVDVTYVAGYQVTLEAAVVPSTAPYEILAQEPYGDWASDGGVVYADGAPLASCREGNPRRGAICGRAREPTHSRRRMQASRLCHLLWLRAGRPLLFCDGLDRGTL